MCSVRVCKISWNDSGAVYLGMDKIRNPDAEKTGVPVSKNFYFDAVEPVIKKYEKESLKKEGRKKNDKNAE